MEKRNVVEQRRTPQNELTRPDENWDKTAANLFETPPVIPADKKSEKPATKESTDVGTE